MPGSDPKTKWGDLWNLDDLPHIENPKSGLLINANSTPWLTPQDDEIKPNAWPAYVTTHGSTTRYERLAVELNADNRITTQTAMKYATDTLVPNALQLIKFLPSAGQSASAASSDYTVAIDLLHKWNGRADLDARGCTLYLYWLLADKGNLVLAKKAGAGGQLNETDKATLITTLKSACAKMQEVYHQLDVPWGEVHVSIRGAKVVPVTGLGYFASDDSTSCVTPNFGPMIKGRIECTGGSSFRMITEMDPKGVRSWSILPYGDSQNPTNPHYADQMELFGKGEYKDTFFGVNRIRKAAVSHIDIKIR